MANPFGEKNIGPWEGQQVEYIPLDDLVLWTENPRDPLDGDYTNDDVIRRATDGRNEKQWQLSKLSKEMGDRFDLSELPTVCRIDDGPKYRVYDGNRRVILAMLRKAGLTTEGQQQLVPPDFPDPIPCNVCDEETALENVERKHRGNGSWKQYERDRFMFDYRGGPKTVLIRLEELIKAVTKWPALNMRYVEDDVFNKKHLEEMGLLPDEPDFGVPLELLEELVEGGPGLRSSGGRLVFRGIQAASARRVEEARQAHAVVPLSRVRPRPAGCDLLYIGTAGFPHTRHVGERGYRRDGHVRRVCGHVHPDHGRGVPVDSSVRAAV